MKKKNLNQNFGKCVNKKVHCTMETWNIQDVEVGLSGPLSRGDQGASARERGLVTLGWGDKPDGNEGRLIGSEGYFIDSLYASGLSIC